MNERAARIGRNLPPGVLPPPISDEEREQWSTLCSIATDLGICPNPAIDSSQPVKLCQVHTSVILTQTINRLRAQFETDNEIDHPGGQDEQARQD